ncbi:nucleotidyltransferase family protein [Clostridium uliginosum]|uniref:Predicted nucleotidyltransferase n=1 Tax=Clostridium uliginosum TaxID=119641 RepID=A0A1I1Q9F2_9CLOT|nr:nucleotidyltransferase domain-containing protein [Clostridium uliginosum]SFD15853.1 Predicted nucleotidyltransferase [Clostridium uliginosum]
MKANVEYDLDRTLREEIVKVRDTIKKHIKNSEVSLFGSIAKGRYSKNSDIDILVLINEEKTLKEIRVLKHFLEDKIEILRLIREVDLKIYTKSKFFKISSTPSFEQAILKDLIDLRRW